jgi:energy-coupling factor transport system permease protein
VKAEFYRPGTSFLHAFDPRAKLFLLVPVVACFFLPAPAWVPAAFAAALAAVIVVSLGPRELLPPLQAMAPVLLFIVLLTPPFHRAGPAVIDVNGFALLTADGLRETVTLVVRFVGITLGFFAVVRTVSLDDLVLSLRWFGLPYSVCLVVIVTLRTMPTLAATWRNVQDAHRLRSGPPEERAGRRGRRRKVTAWLPMLTSLLVEAVKGIPLLAMALESRGFGRRNTRTAFAELKRGGAFIRDAAVCLALAALFLCPLFFAR